MFKMLDEEDKMFRDALIESQKEYAAFLDSWPTFSDHTKVFLLLFLDNFLRFFWYLFDCLIVFFFFFGF